MKEMRTENFPSKKNNPFKPLTKIRKQQGGRNHYGRITVRFRGGGHKRLLRSVDFHRQNSAPYFFPNKVKVEKIEYDPNRSASIALVSDLHSIKKKHYYILAHSGISEQDILTTSQEGGLDIRAGNTTSLRFIPLGTEVHDIELYPGKGGQLSRAAGASAVLLKKDVLKDEGMLRLNSGKTINISLSCLATIGQVSNVEHQNRRFYKAGQMRWLGFRPHVRGVAMNPIDHPHGGGEGKTSGGRPSCSPWGKPTKGLKTRKKSKKNR